MICILWVEFYDWMVYRIESSMRQLQKIFQKSWERKEIKINLLREHFIYFFTYIHTPPSRRFNMEYYWWSTFWEQLLSGAVPELEMKIFSVHCVRFSLAFEWTNKLIYSSVLQASIQKLSQMEALIMSSLPKNQIQIDQRNITAETGTKEIIRGIKIN